VDLFMTIVGVPPDMIAGMHQAPMWPGRVAIAPTLAYDAACMNGFVIPRDRAARIKAPTLVMNGGAGFDFMRTTAKELAQIIPDARYRELPGQRHDVDPNVIAPVLDDFFCTATAGVGG
jgi:pimeloyl-ACP methyl ester carboxylesterase